MRLRVMHRRERTWLIAILLLSVLLRVGVALYLGDTVPAGKDEQSYSVLAARLAAGYGYSFDRPWYPYGTPAGSPTSHWSFLYTAFTAAVYAVAGPHPLAARLVQAVLAGLLLPWLAWRLARRLQIEDCRLINSGREGRSSIFNLLSSVPLLAALLSAVYAYFVLYAAMVQTEAFYICALLWSLERGLALGEILRGSAAQRSSIFHLQSSISLGLSLGIATLLRQSILPWVVVLFAWQLFYGLKIEDRKIDDSRNSWHAWPARLGRRLAPLAVAGAVLLACIAPFTIRNAAVYGEFLLLNSNAGYAMYSAQHPLHGASFQEYAAAELPADLAGLELNEAQWDRELMRRGIGFVLAEPGRYALLSLSRVRDYFEFWPTADSSTLFNAGRVLSIGVFLPFMLYGVGIAVWEARQRKGRRKREEGKGPRADGAAPTIFDLQSPIANGHSLFFHLPSSFFLLLFVLFYSVLHIATWAMSRYRLPVDAVLLLFAAAAIADLGRRWRGGGRGAR